MVTSRSHDGPMPDREILSSVADELPVGVWVARVPTGELLYANRAFGEIMGMDAREDVAVGAYAEPYGIFGRDGEPYPESRMPFVRAIELRTVYVADDIVIHRPDGRHVNIRAQARPVFDGAGTITHVVIAFIDISGEAKSEAARVESEARLAHAQRMQSIGNLAGGVAHDFNNMLLAVKVLVSHLRTRETDPEKLAALGQIEQVTDSATQVTRALLGFAGRGKNLAQKISLNESVVSMTQLVKRMLDRIEVVSDTRAVTGFVVGDHSQLDQVLMNLVMNARDAMPEGGRLEIATRDVALDAADARLLPPLSPGRHVVLEVRDTGPGIDVAIRRRVFEPYFSTKIQGDSKGTGLGLATVYGIVESHHGVIEIADNVPHGTIMRVYFPAAPSTARAPTPQPFKVVRSGGGKILLVEDEALVRSATEVVLRRIGYEVLSAADGEAGLAIYREHHAQLAAVVQDLVMPGIRGKELYLALRAIDPDVPVLLVTGHALNEEVQEIVDLGARAFLPKPYGVETLSSTLAAIVRRVPGVSAS